MWVEDLQRVMGTPRTARFVWAGFAIIWIALLIPQIAGILRGQADAWHNEHWRMVTLSGGSLFLALSGRASKMRIKQGLIVVSCAILAASFWLMR